MKHLSFAINIFLGVLFILSAYSKLFPVEYFELELVDQNIASWFYSPFLARLIIGFELFIGLALLFQLRLKKITLPLTFGFLGLMSIYLIFIFALKGNQENCGCYGELIPMSTIESLVKNGILLLLTFISYRKLKLFSKKNYRPSSKFKTVLFYSLFPLSIIIVSLINPPIDIYNDPYTLDLKIGDQFDLILPGEQIYPDEFFAILVSSTCGHCKRVKRKIDVARRKYNNFPEVFFYIEGKEEEIQEYMFNSEQEYQYEKIGLRELLTYTRGHFPIVLTVKNKEIIKVQNSRDFLSENFESMVD